MTIQQVQYILEVSQTGSISRAASNLFLAQSNLSSAIRSLEQELGFPIFTRSNRGIQPTEQGLLVLEQAGYMWECYQKMRQASAIQTTAHIRIGGAPYTPVCEAYNRLCEAYQDYERLDFSYVILPIEEMIEKLYLSLLDLGLFMVSPDAREAFQKRIASKNLVVHPIAKVPIVLRIGPKHPLYHKAEIKLSDFADCAFVHHKGSLGTDLEVQYRPPDYHLPEGEPSLIFPNREKVPKPLLSKLTGIAFGVREIAPVRALLEERYGIGPWVLSGPDVHGGRHAVCESLNLRLELVAPPDPEDGGDVLAAYLKKNGGNGIFYITLEAPQGLEAPLKAMERAGGKVIFQSEEAALVDFTELFGGYFRIEAAQQP